MEICTLAKLPMKALKNVQKLFNSGKISPNLVTLDSQKRPASIFAPEYV